MVKLESEVPKSRPEGLWLTLKSHGSTMLLVAFFMSKNLLGIFMILLVEFH